MFKVPGQPTYAPVPMEALLSAHSVSLPSAEGKLEYARASAFAALQEVYSPTHVDRALDFIQLVREQLAGRPAAYDQFFKALKLYEEDRVDLVDVLLRLTILCADVPIILLKLNYFLPSGYSFSLSMRKQCVELSTPAGVLIQPLVA
ncbi:hypothetical protein C8Q73DRAFT_258066 [Cubamyces lactineus]|nr:hypothetical protein C8Q73DRAFT_258066 [Cubamyces lactineus]